MIEMSTLLGCAFASADCILETDEAGRVAFSSGAVSLLRLGRNVDPIGKCWEELFPAHRDSLRDVMASLPTGRRAGPYRVQCGDSALGRTTELQLSVFRNPKTSARICWAVTQAAAPAMLLTDAEARSQARADFDKVVDQHLASGPVGAAALLDLDRTEVDAAGQSALDTALSSGSMPGIRGARLDDRKYAFLAEPAQAQTLQDQLATALGVDASKLVQGLSIKTLDEINPSMLRYALQLTLDRFSLTSRTEPADLGTLFETHALEVKKRADALQTRVRHRLFEMVYQPIVSIRSKAVHHSEALIRFDPGESPFELVKLAENVGIINDLDWAAINQVIAELRNTRGAAPIAANLSAFSLSSERFITEILGALRRSPAAAQRLKIEITESAAIQELARANTQIQRLRSAGIEVALDDFGAGAASLSYLRQLEVDTVKIDAQYIRGLKDGERGRAIVRDVVQLCRGVGAKTVAEGVETEHEAAALISMGVDYGQGWLFGRPAAAPARQSVAQFLEASQRRVAS